jgi:hypothetical protein
VNVRFLLAVLLLAPQERSAEELLKALVDKVAQAKTLRVESEAVNRVTDGKSWTIRFRTLAKGADRWKVESEATPDDEGFSFSAVSDGSRIRVRARRPMPVQSLSPAESAAAIRRDVALSVDSGIFFAFGEAGKPQRPPEIGPARDGGREKVDGREARILEYDVTHWWDKEPLKSTVRVHVDPVELRLLRGEARSEYFTWRQTFTVFRTDEEIADSEFATPWKKLLARAQAGQLAESAGLFALYTGRHPRALDELLRRPAWLEPDVFYPDGGFVLGGRLPKDPWGRAFELRGGRVVSPGAEGDAGAEVPVATREAVGAPSPRLKRHYEARVQLHLHAAAVRACQALTAELPKKRSALWEKPDGVEAWPEGGWIARTALPEDPWGQPIRLITDEHSARVQVQDPKARRILRRDLTGAEVEALERAAQPRVAEEDAREIGKLLARCVDDDLETRQAAAKEAKGLGPVLVPFLERRRGELRDPDRLRWLSELRESFPERPPTWLRELGSLVVTVGTAAAAEGELGANERNASASLKTLATAEADFRANDRDNNRVQDFWTGDVAGLYTVKPAESDEMIKLVELALASADAAPLGDGAELAKVAQRGPKAGYWYQALASYSEEGKSEPYAQDTKGEKGRGKAYHNTRFAFCAFPSEYGITGTRTFLISEMNQVYWKDTGGEPVLEFPSDDDLLRDWKKLD